MLRQDNGQIFLDEKSGLQMHLPNQILLTRSRLRVCCPLP
jgi:hypothetical protein